MRERGSGVSFAIATTLALASVLAHGRARADDGKGDQADTNTDAESDEVLVRGQGAGGFVSRTRIEDEPREVTDAASLVEPLPGVHVRRLGADDSFATLSIRGTSSTEVAVYLAGVPLSGGADPTLDLATLPLWPGAQARVYRSFAPAALGRGSLGGTLVIDPPSPRAEARTDVWTAAGSFGSRRLRVGDVRGDPNGVRVATGVSASRSDDDFTYLDPAATLASGHDVYATRVNSGHAAASGLASVALPLHLGALGAGEGGALTLTGLAQARRQELPGSVTAPTPYQRLDSSRLLEAIELTIPAGRGALGLRAWGRREELALHDANETALGVLGARANDETIVATGASFGWKGRPTEASSIEARVDGSAERFLPGTSIGGAPPPGASRASTGLALDAQARATRILTLSASARGDVWIDGTDDASSEADARPTGNVGAEIDTGPVMIASHAGVLARPASFVERFGDRGSFIGDPSLRPESAKTVDLGARLSRRVSGWKLSLEGATFASWAEDLIVFVPVGAEQRQKATNIGRARLLGVEGEARANGAGFDLRVSYTGLATTNESDCHFDASGCTRPPLPGRPAHDLVGDIVYAIGPARLRYGVDFVSGIRADAVDRIIVPARVLHGAGVRVAVHGARGLTLALDVRNLFDLRVAEYPGVDGPVRAPIGDLYDFPLPGRTFLASARWTSAER